MSRPVSPAAGLCFISLVLTTTSLVLFSRKWANTSTVLKSSLSSPRETLLPRLSRAQCGALPYSPNLLPGARDVQTPYGVMRVYEWGPDSGRKVLLLHGDTTPSPMLGPIAMQLVERGCRVMLIDLWGRGYSDTPLDVDHDSRLFTMQIISAITSSNLSWTGEASGGFSIVGFSLGGAISMAFAAYFSHLLNFIVLLAPGGLLRYLPVKYTNPLLRYHHLVPSKCLRKAVANIVGAVIQGGDQSWDRAASMQSPGPDVPQDVISVNAMALDIPAIVQWQFDHHQGFCHSFANTVTYGPIMNQDNDWSKVRDALHRKDPRPSDCFPKSKLNNSKILVIFGDTDKIVRVDDVSKDMLRIFGSEHLDIRTVPGGHDFPVPKCDLVVNHILDFWQSNLSS